jgi:prepilin-type N-terminal cleavage/methylation domain-containing protein
MNTTIRHRLRRHSGMTLIELMISMTLGLMILLGLTSLFVQSKRSFKQDEIIARMQEDGRFAMTELQRDIALSGFWADVLDPSPIVNMNGALVDALYTYATPIEVFDNTTGAETPFDDGTIDDLVPGTDVVAIRKLAGVKAAEAAAAADVAGATAALTAGDVYLITNGVVARMALGSDMPADDTEVPGAMGVPLPFTYWAYDPVVYFVRDYYTTDGDNIPTLCRKYLAGSALTIECLAAGVEDFQVEYGVDTDDDDYADQYVQDPTAAQMLLVTSVRVFILMRGTDADPNYTNHKTYVVSNSGNDHSDPADGYYRRVYTTTIMVRNNAHLMALN